MNKQNPCQEAVRRQQVLLFAKRLPQRPEQLDELAVMGRQLLDVPAFTHLQAQCLGGQHVVRSGFEDNGLFLGAEIQQRGIHVGTVAAGARQHHWRNRTKALPLQLLAHLFALVLSQLREHHQAPGAIPSRHRGAVYPLEGLVEPPPTRPRQAVIATATHFFGGEPALLGQAKNRSADQTLIDTNGFEQLDQAAKPNRTTVGFDRIPIQGDDQRAGADRRLLLEAGDKRIQRSKGRHGRTGQEKKLKYTRRPGLVTIMLLRSLLIVPRPWAADRYR